MSWWYGHQDSTKGAWDVDLKEHPKYKSRKAGLRIIFRGIISLVIFLILWFAISSLLIYLNIEKGNFLYYFFRFIGFGLLILLASTLQIPIGLYYFIKYFKVKEE